MCSSDLVIRLGQLMHFFVAAFVASVFLDHARVELLSQLFEFGASGNDNIGHWLGLKHATGFSYQGRFALLKLG